MLDCSVQLKPLTDLMQAIQREVINPISRHNPALRMLGSRLTPAKPLCSLIVIVADLPHSAIDDNRHLILDGPKKHY